MSDEKKYRHNHYVPEWYQKRFMKPDQSKYWYLDLNPDTVTNGKVTYKRRDLLNWGSVSCFAQDDLYTVQWGAIKNTEIERFFFGRIDDCGKDAVEHFSNYDPNKINRKEFQNLLTYMSVQKLRTPKGLKFLRKYTKSNNLSLVSLQRMQSMFCATWCDCVWQIADASSSATKFIISDHPVTVYNRDIFPLSEVCRNYNDPDVRLAATHTFFPLSLDKVLILTNLTWVRNPYQKEINRKPNPDFFRSTIFKFTEIQIGRMLSEEEVIEINYVTKQRAHRYIAAAEKEWLYPERRLNNPHWRKLGNGYLFMPEPRIMFGGGDIIIGHTDGSSTGYDAYGRRPWQPDYKEKSREEIEVESQQRFKAEWAAMQGPQFRAYNYEFAVRGKHPIKCDSADSHASYLEVDKIQNAKPGERQRRRRLRK